MKRELEGPTATQEGYCVCLCVRSCVCVGGGERANKQELVKTREEGKMAGQETGQIYRVPFQFLKACPHYINSSDYRGSGEALR